MKLSLTLLIFLWTFHSFSQETKSSRDSISANNRIQKDSISIFNFTILKNKDSINLYPSDTLKSSIFTQINKLDEVFIDPKSEFNAVSLGIIKKEIKPLSINERRLYTAGDFKPIHLLSILGGSLQVDPIINAISGRTKRLKRNIRLEKKESTLIFLEDHFTEYMLNNLKIPEEIIGRFLNYLIGNENLQDLIDRKDYGELHFLIGDEWFTFEGLQKNSPTITTDEIQKD